MDDLSRFAVLVVDDVETDIDILVETLGDEYDLSIAMDGPNALEIAEFNAPDLILLDIMMPGMDGYEVCRQLKANEKTREIPVVFVTSKIEVEDETRGFELGAVDYITKPLSPSLVKARVKAHLELSRARKDLKKQNEILKENIRLREDIERIAHHDLKSPLTGIINYPLLLLEEDNFSEKQQSYLKAIYQLGHKMLKMINISLDLYKMEQGIYQIDPVPVNVLQVINEIVSENQIRVNNKKLSIIILLNGKPPNHGDGFIVYGEQLLFYSMLANILNNAIEASPDGGPVTITLEKKQAVKIRIHNKGVVPEGIRNNFFDKYVTSGKKLGTGLGTYSARMIAEVQGGGVRLDTSESEGTVVTFSFPNPNFPQTIMKNLKEENNGK